MFKKRGQRNFRRKAASSDEEDEKPVSGVVSVGGVSLPGLALGKKKKTPESRTASSASLLSFPNEEEEAEGGNLLKLKKTSSKQRMEKLKKAPKAPSPDSTLEELEDVKPALPLAEVKIKHPPPPSKPRPVVTVEEADSSTGDVENLHSYNPDSKLRTAMKAATASGSIPDAQMVFMARKRRQAVREGGDVILVDDVQKYHRQKGRLQREEDEDGCSSGEEGGRFYSKSANLNQEEEERRRGQEAFLEVEQGESSGEDEFGQWERDQIRKCIPGAVVTQMEEQAEAQKKKRLYAQYGTLGQFEPEQIKEEEMELDSYVDSELPKSSPDQIPLPPSRSGATSLGQNGRGPKLGGGTSQSTKKPSNLGDLLAKLNIGLKDAESMIRAKELELEKLSSHLVEVETTIAGLEATEPKHQLQFQLYQECRAYIRDLLDCFDEKSPVIEETMEKLYKLVGSRAEGLWKRRRMETRDEYDEVIASDPNKVQAPKDPQLLLSRAEGLWKRRRMETRDEYDEVIASDPNKVQAPKDPQLLLSRAEGLWKRRRMETRDEYDEVIASDPNKVQALKDLQLLLRIAERQGRRTRRRQERERQSRDRDGKHNDGDSTDEEEIPSKIATYQIDLKKIRDESEAVFADALEDFSSVKSVLGAFQNWLVDDPDSFQEAYIALNIPKLLSPLIRLQLLHWNPICPTDAISVKLEDMEWFKECLLLGSPDVDDPSVVELIPNIADKIVLPHLTGLVRGSWDVSSRSQCERLATTLEDLRVYPSLKTDTASVNRLMEALHGRARECIDDDLFTPIFPYDSSAEAKAFLDRQFWGSLKVLSNLVLLRDWFSPAALEELAVDGVLNRHLVLSLQSSSLTSTATITKARAIVGALPSHWPTNATNPAQFQPIVKMLWRIGEALHDDRASRDTLKDLYKLVLRLDGKSKSEKFLLNFVR